VDCRELGKMVLGESNQQFSQVNTTSLASIPLSKNSPVKMVKCQAVVAETFLQSLRPMKDVNTSFDEEI
jgi:hypothetical protein